MIDSLAALLTRLDPEREFHRASPYKGDDHYWGVWHGQEPYTKYRVVRPFRSEAGVNTFPVPEDYARFTPPGLLWPLDTTYVEYHGEYNTRFELVKKLNRYADEFGASSSIGDEIQKSELYQALATSFNMEFCRSHKFQNSGVLIWQYNDIWPCISWSIVDWYGTPKPSYYFLKRAAEPVHVAADYERYRWKAGETFAADIHLLNDTEDPVADCTYEAKLISVQGKTARGDVGHRNDGIEHVDNRRADRDEASGGDGGEGVLCVGPAERLQGKDRLGVALSDRRHEIRERRCLQQGYSMSWDRCPRSP